MRSAVIAAAFALAVGASATVNVEYRADGSIERITNGESDSPAPERARLAWAEDAHIHRLKRLTDKSRHRAKTTTTWTTSTDPCPTPSPTPSCVPGGGACTIGNFLDCCTQCCIFATGDTQNGVCCTLG